MSMFKKEKVVEIVPVSKTIKVYKHDPKAKLPTRNLATDAGGDLYAIEDVFIPLGKTVKINTGLSISVPVDHVGKIEDRSSLGSRGLKVCGGVIDHGYNGPIAVILTNLSYDLDKNPNLNNTIRYGYNIKAGERIAQILLYQVNTNSFEETKEIWTSTRGSKGLGSSGR